MAKPAYIYDGTQWVPIGPSLGPNSPIAYQTSAPSSPYTGQVWTDSDEGQKILRVWTGSAWALFDGYSTTTPTISTQSASTYTLTLSDSDDVIVLSTAGAVVTVPTNATVAFPVGTRTQLVNTSSGDVSVVGASGVTMTGVQTIASHQMMTLIKLGTDSWERISAVSSETGIHSFTSMGA